MKTEVLLQRMKGALRRGGEVVARWVRAHPRETMVLLLPSLILLAPFLLKPADSSQPARPQRKLVVLTPHPEQVRAEFGQAFTRHWKAVTGETVAVDWRVPGGTSEIATLLKSEFNAAFQRHWVQDLKQTWSPAVAQAFMNAKSPSDDPARQAFLRSQIGIGVDLFFGGGAYDFQMQAEAGSLVAQVKPGTGVRALRERHPDWFDSTGIPENAGGEPFRDAEDRWVGTCLSSFGIVFNRDTLRRLGIEKDPEQWSDLADPRLFGQIALADPGRSATVTKAFEMLIQQEMQRAIERLSLKSEGDETAVVNEGIRQGWVAGLKLIQRISANARYFSDSSSKIPLDVARGDAAAGLCIDYYGRSTEEIVRRADGHSRVGFVMPVGGSSISVDPIGLLRGAPEPDLATAFMEFVLSDAGQKIWSYRVGEEGGPARKALRRLPVRPAFYHAENLKCMSDASEMPYQKIQAFTYHPEWTGAAFHSLRFLIRIACVDTHEEQRQAWSAMIQRGFPSRAQAVFHELNLVRYDTATGTILQTVRARDKIRETRLARELSDAFRANYRLAERLAHQGQ